MSNLYENLRNSIIPISEWTWFRAIGEDLWHEWYLWQSWCGLGSTAEVAYEGSENPENKCEICHRLRVMLELAE